MQWELLQEPFNLHATLTLCSRDRAAVDTLAQLQRVSVFVVNGEQHLHIEVLRLAELVHALERGTHVRHRCYALHEHQMHARREHSRQPRIREGRYDAGDGRI